ncbi:MAG: LysR family transcriptional regulator [Oricola sp.]
MYDWNDLKFFLAVARHGSTTAAAKAMGISQSTVQRRLVEFERRLGQRVVNRHPQGYRLTALGEELLPLAEDAERAAFAVGRRAAAYGSELAGPIRLTCPEALVDRLIRSGLLETFRERYPALTVELAMSDRFMDLAKGEADIAIRAGDLAGDELIGRKLADSHWALFASASYVERHGGLSSPSELDSHIVVGFDGPLKEHRAAVWFRKAAPKARSIAHNNSIPGLLQAVRAGLGIAPLPVVLGLEHGLIQLFEPVPELTTAWYLLVHRDLRQTPRIAAFWDFVGENLTALRPVLSGGPAGAAPPRAA